MKNRDSSGGAVSPAWGVMTPSGHEWCWGLKGLILPSISTNEAEHK